MNERQALRVIGANVRRARLNANLTQECLAQLVGVQWQTISYLENGKYPYPVMRFARLVQVLEVSADSLLEGLPPPNKAEIEKIKKRLARKRRPKSR